MLQRDYLLEIISEFVETVSRALRAAVLKADPEACKEVEMQVGDLIDLDADTAMSLAPDSLVTMMVLSGMGDSVASYVAYALDRLSRTYAQMGERDLAMLRHVQAAAVAESFGCDLSVPPDGLEELDAELFPDAEEGVAYLGL